MLAPPLSLAHVVALLSGEDQPEGAQQPLGRGGHLDSALRKSEAATQNIMMIYHSRRERSSLSAVEVIWILLSARARLPQKIF